MRSLHVTMGSVLTLVLALLPAARAADITTGSLLKEMTDLERLATFPEPAYVNRQFSSYDRAAKSPAENWFANGDQGQYLRTETGASGKKEFVLMDAEGPGAIVRIWSADPKGTIRIYIDGAKEPALAEKMAELLTGKVKPFVTPIACDTSRGTNIYFPFPYAKSCKVTGDESPFYYHVNYRTYPPLTNVESYAAVQLGALQAEISRVAAEMANPLTAAPKVPAAQKMEFLVNIPAGGSKPLFTLSRGGAIRELRLGLSADPLDEALRKCVLVGRFDGEEKPSIWAPVGDFFGAAPGINPYQSLPLGHLQGNEMYCHWVMPFKKSAAFEILNLSGREVSAKGGIQTGRFVWSDRAMHFHARWKAEYEMATRPMKDWNYVDVDGKGVYVGNSLAVTNPVKAWWGEGDEKIYVDGEKFPSHFGTGTEDYYGYAWCCNEPFQHAYHNQPRCDGPGNFGHTSVNRWHILDDIPFTKSFRFDMEIWHWHETCKVSYAVTNYWYGRPGAADRAVEYSAADLRIPALPERAAKVKGAIEGESLKILAVKGKAEPQDMGGFADGWSGETQLWWTALQPGDAMRLEFQAPKAGRYRVTAAMTKAVDYGIHQLAVNGQKAGEPMDFFNRGVIPTGPVDLGLFDLKEGANELSVQCIGSNPAASPKNHMFGLDYLILKPE